MLPVHSQWPSHALDPHILQYERHSRSRRYSDEAVAASADAVGAAGGSAVTVRTGSGSSTDSTGGAGRSGAPPTPGRYPGGCGSTAGRMPSRKGVAFASTAEAVDARRYTPVGDGSPVAELLPEGRKACGAAEARSLNAAALGKNPGGTRKPSGAALARGAAEARVRVEESFMVASVVAQAADVREESGLSMRMITAGKSNGEKPCFIAGEHTYQEHISPKGVPWTADQIWKLS